MDILLHPLNDADNKTLNDVYENAFSEAVELFIVSAYLTEWSPKSKLNKECDEMLFVVGTDFGITTKNACRNVLNWLPKSLKNDFLAADGLSGFHPKLMAWKSKNGSYNLVLGSSNLTQAAFSTNYEANIFSSVSKRQYEIIKGWVLSIKDNCSPISEDWIDQYNESERGPKRPGKKSPLIVFNLPAGDDIDLAITQRRKQQKSFLKIKYKLLTLIKSCAKGSMKSIKFYEAMMELWGNSSDSRFQGRGFEILGKHSDWQQTCQSLATILKKADSASISSLDSVVRREIDILAEAENPNRGAWFSEMLCHFFPNHYPLVNKPVKMWLQKNRFRGPRKASVGSKYIDLAVKLRIAIKGNCVNNAKNLAELDNAIWQWCDNQGGDD